MFVRSPARKGSSSVPGADRMPRAAVAVKGNPGRRGKHRICLVLESTKQPGGSQGRDRPGAPGRTERSDCRLHFATGLAS